MFTKTTEVRIETSTTCNYNCIICPHISLTRKKETMNNNLFDLIISKILKEIPYIKHLTISGFGEFSTDKEWKYKLKKAKENFNIIHVITNLSLLNKEDIDFILKYITDIRISIYAISDNTYNKVHNPPMYITFKKIKDNILYITKKKNNKQKIILNYVEIPENMHETKKWIKFWKNKVDLIEVWKPHNWIDGKSYRDICNHRLQTCGRPFNGPIQIQVDGTVNVCCFDYNGQLIIGDLKNQTFSDIFNGKIMKKIQNFHVTNNADKIYQCKVCDQRNCADCKSKELLYNSKFDLKNRIQLTSTIYDNLQE